RMELPQVFSATHEFLFELLKKRKITGVRVDHPDGLWNPKQYFERLQAGAGKPLYVVAEKILSRDEMLPENWPVDGTTGYDFLNRVNGLFVNPENENAFDALYREFAGCAGDFATVVYQSKKRILRASFSGELNALTRRLQNVAAQVRAGAGVCFNDWRDALAEIIVAFPVYRTYVTADTRRISHQDRDAIENAIAEAMARTPAKTHAAISFIERVLLLETESAARVDGISATREFILKFQQLTGPVAAKGVEDTAFYNYNRLLSLNEVGGDPARFGIGAEAFHRWNENIAARWPDTLLTTATHDTKRGEDVRARINVLSEMPDEWRSAISRWKQFNADKKSSADGRPAPSANDEYLFYQTLVGAWPDDFKARDRKKFCERITACVLKSAKEAKARTTWTRSNAPYENAIRKFIARVLAVNSGNSFLRDFEKFQRRVSFFAKFNSLSQTILKITSPGVPDFYQGGELWDLNLVDPDNRRPVDFDLRRKFLAELKTKFAKPSGILPMLSSLLESRDPGRIKLFVIWRALEWRKRLKHLFASGNYTPFFASGMKKNHVVALAREDGNQIAISVAPKWVFGLTHGAETPPMGRGLWRGTHLELPEWCAGKIFQNAFTKEKISVRARGNRAVLELGEVLENFPVAMLV
ncbi:MAG TPA: malto-oligosyltrehalose synthase, partial [Verrucomicrobiae bacterium]|nr:malto-oligosyltrehalose synthase [Verrucomicrobiae bacterium]